MTRGRMACATLAPLIWSLLACAPLPEGLLTPTATLKAPTAVVRTATPTNTRVPTAKPTHLEQRPGSVRGDSRSRQRALDSALAGFEGVPLWHSDPLGRSYTGAAAIGCSESRSCLQEGDTAYVG